MRFLFYTILLLIALPVFSSGEFQAVDARSRNVPSGLRTPEAISRHLTQHLETDREKARAIFIWITHNIRYDLGLGSSPRRYSSPEEVIREVLARRRGVCHHYATLFQVMSRHAGLESYLISGYTRQKDGKISSMSHAWNGIVIGENYYLLDATWAAGYVHNNRYVHQFRDDHFLITPEKFIATHKPFDPMWQFLTKPLSHHDLLAGNYSAADNNGNFSFTDSIAIHISMDRLPQLQASNRRISQAGTPHPLIRKQLEENQLQITNIYYNTAIEALNSGVDQFNQYVQHKNRQFRNPSISAAQATEMLTAAEKEFTGAQKILDELKTTDRELSQLIATARRRLPGLLQNLQREKQFLAMQQN